MQHIKIHTDNPKTLFMDGYIEILKGESMHPIIIYMGNPKALLIDESI